MIEIIFEQSVKQIRLLCTEFHELIHLHHPLVSIRSHILPIIPAFYSRELLKFVCPIHCWASHGSSSNRLLMQHSTSKQISIVEKRRFQRFQPFSCGIPQPFLAHADSKYAEFRAMDPASKSGLELQPRIGSYVGLDTKFCPYGQHGCTGTQLQDKQLVSRWHQEISICF